MKSKGPGIHTLLLLGVGAAVLVACNGEGINRKPDNIGTIIFTEYDGVSDDLLTAGLGKTGLAGAAPAVANPASPTAAELRRLAIYTNYRAIVDMTDAGGSMAISWGTQMASIAFKVGS